ncbi:hypothetical protein WOLCODRAFT_161823 [Wolfiporia cocos MD-104 SS10]|uniref:Uncharacterized protein n=1 Tax=Wolfiporia cocos (strain MD-104) TaxID=742152 RepID=A0A2H3JA47_WOLCO|nr:hypothetical protein WOLCODRAFT_161823 [Wolfiporia cocos MD-104 SS10]
MLDQNGSSSNGGDVEINANDFAQTPIRACTKSERLHRVRDKSACIGIFDIISPALSRADGSLVGASGTADDILDEDAQINAIGKVHTEGRSQENE